MQKKRNLKVGGVEQNSVSALNVPPPSPLEWLGTLLGLHVTRDLQIFYSLQLIEILVFKLLW